MILFKVLGALFLVLSASSAAVVINRGYDLEIRTIEGYIELIRYIRTQIDLYALPIDEILKRCDDELILRCGGDAFERARDISELFSGASVRDKAAQKEIEEFCSDFGRNYREEQLKRCDASISALDARREALRGDVQNKKKMSYTLSLSAAAALIILLI